MKQCSPSRRGPRTKPPRSVAATRRWTRAWPRCRYRGPDQLGAQLGARERPSGGYRTEDHRDASVRVVRSQALLPQTARIARYQLGSGKRRQPPVVIGGDQVKGPPVEPTDQQGLGLRQGVVHVVAADPGAPGPYGKARPAHVLGLDGQQALDDHLGAPSFRPAEALGSEPSRQGQPVARHGPSLWRARAAKARLDVASGEPRGWAVDGEHRPEFDDGPAEQVADDHHLDRRPGYATAFFLLWEQSRD